MRTKWLYFVLAAILLLAACGEEATDDEEAQALSAALDAAGIAGIDGVLDAYLGALLADATTRIEAIIPNTNLSLAAKHAAIAPVLREIGPVLQARAETALRVIEGRDLGAYREEVLQLLHLARNLGIGAQKAVDTPYWANFPSSINPSPETPFAPESAQGVLDKFWLFYHWTEIMGGMYDDADYDWVFADSGRESFLAEEAGGSGFEQFHDYWKVAKTVWDDAGLSDNEKLMASKYTMWQNPDWGGGDHYINEWWSWEAAYKEEDCALFTGNNMAALAALYELTRDPRTLHRLRALLAAFEHFDRFTLDDPDPIALEEPDGRITRGTKTRNLYLDDEMNIFDIEFTGGGVEFHHNNSWPDDYTGRERKNVSRDQYYGLFLGYRVLWEVLTALDDRTTEEQQLLDDLTAHTRLITDYVFGRSNLHWDWGWEYMFYALFEGSCANPPNFTFMMFFGHVGLEEMTGQSFTQFDLLNELGSKLFAFGRSLGKVWISKKLFEPAHTGLTALNQYLSGFYMSDITVADWLFIWPPEALINVDAGRRRLWRRVVAAFYRKYEMLGAKEYRQVAEECFDPALNERPTVQTMFNSYQGDYAKLEPTHVGLENFLLPFALLASRAENRDELATELTARYAELIGDGSIDFDDTDLPY